LQQKVFQFPRHRGLVLWSALGDACLQELIFKDLSNIRLFGGGGDRSSAFPARNFQIWRRNDPKSRLI
jgi:hypothetical protein